MTVTTQSPVFESESYKILSIWHRGVIDGNPESEKREISADILLCHFIGHAEQTSAHRTGLSDEKITVLIIRMFTA